MSGMENDCPTCGEKVIVPDFRAADCLTATADLREPIPVLPTVVVDESPRRNPFVAILKGIGAFALWLICVVVVLGITGLAWTFGLQVCDTIYPWLVGLSGIALVIGVFVFLPLAAFKKTRGFAGVGFFYVSLAFGATLWVWSLLLTYALWGGFAVLVGLVFLGVGILPMAFLATAFTGHWALFFQLLLVAVAVYGSRVFGCFLLEKSE